MDDFIGENVMKSRALVHAAVTCVALSCVPGQTFGEEAAPAKAMQNHKASPATTGAPPPAKVNTQTGQLAPTAPPPPPVAAVQAAPPSAGSSGDGGWTAKDITTILAGLGALCGAGVAAFAIRSNGRSSRATTIQKANENELESLQSKLDDFYGPYLQLSNTNYLIASDLKSRQPAGAEMRILLLLLDPNWRDQFNKGDATLIEEILSIDAKLLDLIQEKSGLVSSVVQPYLWRAASHFRIMKLAAEGKLDNDPQRYEHYVYPKQLDKVIDLEIDRIHGRIDRIRKDPMVLHPPAPDLNIPAHLMLVDWPSRSGPQTPST